MRQLELYASLLRQAPYSPRVWVTGMRRRVDRRVTASACSVLQRQQAPARRRRADDGENAVLMTYFRNNVLHLLALPSLVACAFLNNAHVRTRGHPAPRVAHLSVRGRRAISCAGARTKLPRRRATRLLEDLANHGLLEPSTDRSAMAASAAGSTEAVQLSVLAQVSVQIIERYYLAISLLLRPAAAPEPGGARSAVPADGAAHVAALRAELARSSSTVRCSRTSSTCCAPARCSA